MKTRFFFILIILYTYFSTLLFISAQKLITTTIGKDTEFIAMSEFGTEFTWTFPDKNIFQGQSVFFTFDTAGYHEVLVQATKKGPNNEIIIENNLVLNVLVKNTGKPTASLEVFLQTEKDNTTPMIGKNIVVTRNTPIIFSAKNSVDWSGTETGQTNLHYEWEFDYHQKLFTPEVSKTFTEIGRIPVTLTVYQKEDSSYYDKMYTNIQITNAKPQIQNIQIKKGSFGNAHIEVIVEATDLDGVVTNYQYEVLEKDRIITSKRSDQPKAVFDLSQYEGQHEYFFRITIKDDTNTKTTKTHEQSLVINNKNENKPPENVTIIPSPSNTGLIKQTFYFSTTAMDPDRDILSYEWVFPPNKTIQEKTVIFRRTASYSFPEPGTYPVVLKVSDGTETIETSIDINIFENQGQIKSDKKNSEIEIKGVLPRNTGTIKTIFAFYLRSNTNTTYYSEYDWDFGDGNKSFTKNTRHRYENPGNYTVTVTARSGDFTTTDSIDINVIESNSNDPTKDPEIFLENPEKEILEKEILDIHNDTGVLQLEEELDLINSSEEDFVELDNQIKVITKEIDELKEEQSNNFNPDLRSDLQHRIIEKEKEKSNIKKQKDELKAEQEVEKKTLETKIEKIKKLKEEQKAKEQELELTTNPEKRKELKQQITKIQNNIKDLVPNPLKNVYVVSTLDKIKEFDPFENNICVESLTKLREYKLEQIELAILEEKNNLRKETQNLYKQIKKCQTNPLYSPEIIESFLEEIAILAETNPEFKKLEDSIFRQKNSPFFNINGKVSPQIYFLRKIKLQELQEEKNPVKKRRISKQIKLINKQLEILKKEGKFNESQIQKLEMIHIKGTVATTFYLMANIPYYKNGALFFEWDFGDEDKKSGQNVAKNYKTPGIYKINLTVSDGISNGSDFIMIEVLE